MLTRDDWAGARRPLGLGCHGICDGSTGGAEDGVARRSAGACGRWRSAGGGPQGSGAGERERGAGGQRETRTNYYIVPDNSGMVGDACA